MTVGSFMKLNYFSCWLAKNRVKVWSGFSILLRFVWSHIPLSQWNHDVPVE